MDLRFHKYIDSTDWCHIANFYVWRMYAYWNGLRPYLKSPVVQFRSVDQTQISVTADSIISEVNAIFIMIILSWKLMHSNKIQKKIWKSHRKDLKHFWILFVFIIFIFFSFFYFMLKNFNVEKVKIIGATDFIGVKEYSQLA